MPLGIPLNAPARRSRVDAWARFVAATLTPRRGVILLNCLSLRISMKEASGEDAQPCSEVRLRRYSVQEVVGLVPSGLGGLCRSWDVH